MKNQSFQLPSFDSYYSYKQRIQEQIEQLNQQLQTNQEQLDQASKNYVEAFASGNDIAGSRTSMHDLKMENEKLNHEIQLLKSSNLKEVELARKVYDEYRELQKQVNKERESIHQKSIDVVNKARQTVQELSDQYATLGERFTHEVSKKQLFEILDCLSGTFNENVIRSLTDEAAHGSMPDYRFPNIPHQLHQF